MDEGRSKDSISGNTFFKREPLPKLFSSDSIFEEDLEFREIAVIEDLLCVSALSVISLPCKKESGWNKIKDKTRKIPQITKPIQRFLLRIFIISFFFSGSVSSFLLYLLYLRMAFTQIALLSLLYPFIKYSL